MELTELAKVGKALDVTDQLIRRKYFKKTEVRDLHVSIITVTFNSSCTIRDTLESVRKQTYRNIEHIIIDGCSSDNTLDIVRSFPHVTKCLCEQDIGIYDAMNKGLQMATGDVIGILNSDDFYANNEIIAKVVTAFEKTNAKTVYGDLLYVHYTHVNLVMRKWISGNFKRMSFKFGWMPPHPAFFVKKEVYEKVGSFNPLFKNAADYEMMLRILYKYQFNTLYLPEILVKMRAGGISNGSLKKRLRANREDRLAWKLNGLTPYFFTLYLKPLRKIFQFINKEQFKRLFFGNFL
jgi:glycosyltransferase involved in cell wall biosynthesis